jgi:dienelactone hydrolase
MNYIQGLLLIFTMGLLIACSSSKPEKNIQTREIKYEADSISMTGYFAYDTALDGKRPGVLIVHEWWGYNDYARRRARMLAEAGYSAFALDMYGNGKNAEHPDDAGKFASAVMQDIDGARTRFIAALNVLKSQPVTDKDKIAAIGYSLGHVRPPKPGSEKAKLLVCNGADDPFTTQKQIDTFKAEMDSANVDYTFISYPGAVHSFTNPAADSLAKKFNMPIGYNKTADQKSWSEMLKFFDKIFNSST